jgi:hypothetical protein
METSIVVEDSAEREPPVVKVAFQHMLGDKMATKHVHDRPKSGLYQQIHVLFNNKKRRYEVYDKGKAI